MSRLPPWFTLLLLLAAPACALETEGRANVVPIPDGGFGSAPGDGGDADGSWGYAALAVDPALDEALTTAGGASGMAGAAPY
jgi:hypothetical protein